MKKLLTLAVVLLSASGLSAGAYFTGGGFAATAPAVGCNPNNNSPFNGKNSICLARNPTQPYCDLKYAICTSTPPANLPIGPVIGG